MRRGLVLTGLLLAAGAGPSGAAAEDYALPTAPAVSTSTAKLDFTADHLDYEGSKSLIHLKGNVWIKESTWTIKADELWLDTARRLGRSDGYLLVEDGVSALHGDSGAFDFEKHAGDLHHASAGHADWRIHSRSLSLSQKKLDYYGADFTSCSYDPHPHYHFHSTHITVVPRRYILARNAVFYVGPVPLFYTPFLYKALSPEHFLRIKVQPGYDRRNGGFLKGTMTKSFTPHLYGKLYLDEYLAQGFGTGGELQRHKGEDSRGTLFGYRIHDSTRRERWAVLGDQYQSLASSMAFQARMQVQSDPSFNNDYARSSTLRVTPELVNNAAVVYRLPQATARVSYSRRDVASPNQSSFVKSTESTPRLDVQSTQLKIWRLPWLNTFNGFADNSFDAARPFIQKSVGAGWNGTRVFSLARGLSFTPKADYGQTYFDRLDSPADFLSTATVRDAFVGRYSVQGTVRVASPIGDWDVSQRYARRQRAGSMADDAGAPDHGVEANLLSVEDFFRPAPKILVRAFSGYDFRVFRDRELGFRERVQPIVGQVDYTPRPSLSFSLRDDYALAEGNRSFLFNGVWGDEQATYIGGGAGYNRALSGAYQLSTEFGWAPSTGSWRLAGVLRSQASTSGGVGRLSRFRLFEKELSLTKAWHDFFTSAQVRFRPGGVKEASIRAQLKLGRVSPDSVQRRDWESEWFPERKKGFEDRP